MSLRTSINKKTALIFFSLIFGSFLFGGTAYATSEQTYNAVTLDFDFSFNPVASGFATWQKYVITQTGSLASFMTKDAQAPQTPTYAEIRDSGGSCVKRYYSTTSSTTADHPYVLWDTPKTCTNVASTALDVIANDQIKILFYRNGGSGFPNRGHTPSSTYFNGVWDEAGDSNTNKQNADMFIRFNIDGASEIHFSPTPTSTCEFDAWGFSYSLTPTDKTAAAAAPVGQWTNGVRYGISPDALTYEDLNNYFCWGAGCQNTVAGLPKQTPLTPGFAYYAQAFITNGTDEIATSDIWEFIIKNNSECTTGITAIQGGEIPTATSTNPSDNITCDRADGFFNSSMCNLFQTLFIPSVASLQSFHDLKDRVLNKPPFGYINMASTSLYGLFDSSTTSTQNWNNAASSTEMQISVWAALTPLVYIRTAFGWLFWLIFLFYIYRRFKNFSLHG